MILCNCNGQMTGPPGELCDRWPKPEPEPEPPPEREFSGRLLVRLPKWLHRSLIKSAEREGVSLNQHVAALLSAAEGHQP